MSEPLVIVGNGMAAARLVDELAKVALGRYAIAVIGDEPRLAYNRVLLSSVLAGETTSQDIELRPAVTVVLVRGAAHFRVPIEEGLRIHAALAERVSGVALPRYVIDPPDGSGKIDVRSVMDATGAVS